MRGRRSSGSSSIGGGSSGGEGGTVAVVGGGDAVWLPVPLPPLAFLLLHPPRGAVVAVAVAAAATQQCVQGVGLDVEPLPARPCRVFPAAPVRVDFCLGVGVGTVAVPPVPSGRGLVGGSGAAAVA